MSVLNAIKILCPADYETVLRRKKVFIQYCKMVYDTIPPKKRCARYARENVAVIKHSFKHDSFLFTFNLSECPNPAFWMQVDEQITANKHNYC